MEKHSLHKRHVLHWIIFGVCGFIVIAGLGWMLAGYTIYRQTATQASEQTTAKLQQVGNLLKASTDIAKANPALDTLIADLPKYRTTSTAPVLTGDQKDRLLAINKAIDGVVAAAKDERAYLIYQQETAKTIAGLSAQQASDQAGLNTMAAAWQAAATAMNKQSVPSTATKLHASLRQKVQQASDTTAALASAYQKMDAATYATKKQTLGEQLTQLQKLFADSKKLADLLDHTLADRLDTLRDALQVK